MIVADLVMAPVARVAAEATLAEVARCLAEVGGVVVVDSDALGEVTEHDVVVALARGATPETPVGKIDRPAPAFVERGVRVEEAAWFMIATGRDTLVVVEGGRPIGVIGLRDAASALWGGTSFLGALRLALHVEDG